MSTGIEKLCVIFEIVQCCSGTNATEEFRSITRNVPDPYFRTSSSGVQRKSAECGPIVNITPWA